MQFLIQNDILRSYPSSTRSQPLRPKMRTRAAAFISRVILDARYQRQPARHARAGAGRDDADLAGVGVLQTGRRRGVDR